MEAVPQVWPAVSPNSGNHARTTGHECRQMLTPVEGELPQRQVNAYFQSSSDYWKRIYETRALMPLIYQTRQADVLDWITKLGLPASTKIFEIGCGAGM